MAPPTILAHKLAFLTAQTLQLSQSLAPSSEWRTLNDNSDQAISERVIDDALNRLNHTLQQHVRRAHPPQASRHIAEQIDGLFLDAGEATRRDNEDDNGDGHVLADAQNLIQRDGQLREGIDVATDQVIASLPPGWDVHNPSEAEALPLEAQRYVDLQSSLSSLSSRRAEVQARAERLRRMRDLLEPFRGDTQQNLVTRNGEVEKELGRMRMLLVRVAGRVGQLPDPKQVGEDTVMEDAEDVERSQLQALIRAL